MAGYSKVTGLCAVYINPDVATRFVITEKHKPFFFHQHQRNAIGIVSFYENVTGNDGTAIGFSALL